MILGSSLAAVALAAETHKVAQKQRAFTVSALTIAVGDTVQFINDDDFIHQIYIDSRDFAFDSDESEPGQSVNVRFTKAGTFPVRCHIHPKMLLTVTVK